MTYMKYFGIKKVYYSSGNGKIIELKVNKIESEK